MPNILTRYLISGVVNIGDDNFLADSPEFDIININIDTEEQVLNLEVMHYVPQGSIIQYHSRMFHIPFADLPPAVAATGFSFITSVQDELLLVPPYLGATVV